MGDKLSSIDLMPAEGRPALEWVKARLLERQISQTDILVGLNEQLIALDLPPVSKSAFNRYAVRQKRLSGIAANTQQEATSADHAKRLLLAASEISAAVEEVAAAFKVEAADALALATAASRSALYGGVNIMPSRLIGRDD